MTSVNVSNKATNPIKDERAKWTVRTTIEKYHTDKALEAGKPDEILELPANCLCNDGVNLLWQLVAQDPAVAGKGFDATNSFIGIGDCGGVAKVPAPGDTGLFATTNKLYMKMDTGYPIYGANQKIVFRSTFSPGLACFDWLEWTIANGNGNITTGAWGPDVVRTTAVGSDPAPDPVPVLGTHYDYGVGEDNVVNLNHKQENMGKKYSSATWIVSVEISLS